MQLATNTLLKQKTFIMLPKVAKFLNSVARNSTGSRDAYAVGLSHFQSFLNHSYGGETLENIIELITTNKVNIYTLFEEFVEYLTTTTKAKVRKLAPNTITLYVDANRSYFAYYDIDIVSSKFRRKVRLPKKYKEDEEPIDVSDIRKILLACHNRRLKAYILVLASGGMRALEGLAIRVKDIDFTVKPTKVHLRKEFAKTRVARDVYVSDEASEFLKTWIAFKYRKRQKPGYARKESPDDLVFTYINFTNGGSPHGVYCKMNEEFNKVLASIGMDQRKDGMIRRKITFHTFRRFCKSVIATQTNTDYSEWFLGHAKSPYWTLKETERGEIYRSKIMSHLTFLDYSHLEAHGTSVEARLELREKEIALLRERDLKHEIDMKNMNDRMDKMFALVQENPKLVNVKKEVLSEI